MRVLLVDDEADIGEIVHLTFGLRWPEAEVRWAATGEAGLEVIEPGTPDLVLLDDLDDLKVHIQHRRRKLGDDPQGEPMIVSERGVGYRFMRSQRVDAGRGPAR